MPGGRSKIFYWAERLGRKGILSLWLRTHTQAERGFAQALAGYFRSLGERLAERLHSLEEHSPLDTLIALVHAEEERSTFLTLCRGHITDLVGRGAILEWELSRPRRSLCWVPLTRKAPGLADVPPEVHDEILHQAERILKQSYWGDISDNLKRDIVRVLRENWEEGSSNQDIAEDIRDLLGPAGNLARGMRIARTETTGALNAGGQAARAELVAQGILSGKEWLATEDEKTRPSHEEASGQRVDADEDFEVGEEKAAYPGDVRLSAEERVNCRCTCISTFPDSTQEPSQDTNED